MHSLFDFFSPKKEGLGQVVVVTYKGLEMIGFITQTDQHRLPESFHEQDTKIGSDHSYSCTIGFINGGDALQTTGLGKIIGAE